MNTKLNNLDKNNQKIIKDISNEQKKKISEIENKVNTINNDHNKKIQELDKKINENEKNNTKKLTDLENKFKSISNSNLNNNLDNINNTSFNLSGTIPGKKDDENEEKIQLKTKKNPLKKIISNSPLTKIPTTQKIIGEVNEGKDDLSYKKPLNYKAILLNPDNDEEKYNIEIEENENENENEKDKNKNLSIKNSNNNTAIGSGDNSQINSQRKSDLISFKNQPEKKEEIIIKENINEDNKKINKRYNELNEEEEEEIDEDDLEEIEFLEGEEYEDGEDIIVSKKETITTTTLRKKKKRGKYKPKGETHTTFTIESNVPEGN